MPPSFFKNVNFVNCKFAGISPKASPTARGRPPNGGTPVCYGIFIGAIWANVSWGTYWSWDPKETWALITLMVYAVPAHRNIHINRHVYMTLAFLSILITYFGVNFFLGGMHSYA